MLRKLLLLCAAGGAIAAPIAGARATHGKPVWSSYPRGDLLVIFSGTGGGGYRYHAPAQGAGASCRSPDSTYSESDAYSWRDVFVVGPGGGTSDAPVTLTGAGQLSASAQLGACASDAASSGSCTQSLRPPSNHLGGGLAFPGVSVVLSGRLVTVGAVSELVRGAQSCSGQAQLAPNVVQGYDGLQASVSFPRSLLLRGGDWKAPFTMSGSGLYAGVSLSGSCNAIGCDTANCAQDQPASGGPPSSCSFGESYSGTIEVRVIR
jgi:hypothetical protein